MYFPHKIDFMPFLLANKIYDVFFGFPRWINYLNNSEEKKNEELYHRKFLLHFLSGLIDNKLCQECFILKYT